MSKVENRPAKEILSETINKIRAIGLIHEKLLKTPNSTTVDISVYLGDLIRHLKMSNSVSSKKIMLSSEIDSIPLNVDISMYLGLIVNELITNSYKHAFADVTEGSIILRLKYDGKDHYLTMTDSGASLRDHNSLFKMNTYGMQMLDFFIKQINGSLEIATQNGTTVFIRF